MAVVIVGLAKLNVNVSPGVTGVPDKVTVVAVFCNAVAHDGFAGLALAAIVTVTGREVTPLLSVTV